MIAKCVAFLAIVAQISCSVYNTNYGSLNGVAATRNVIAKGKYPVALENCGPTPDRQIPVTTTQVRTPVQEKPTVRLPYRLPAARTVAHSCTCYKTIVRPRVHQHIITVPSVQRYIETSHRPVVENIHYEAVPYECSSESASSGLTSNVQVASGVSSVPVGSSQIVASSVPVASSVSVPVSSSVSVGSTFPFVSSVPVGSFSSGYTFSGVRNYN